MESESDEISTLKPHTTYPSSNIIRYKINFINTVLILATSTFISSVIFLIFSSISLKQPIQVNYAPETTDEEQQQYKVKYLNLKSAQFKILGIQNLKEYKDLPFCLQIPKKTYNKQQIMKSIAGLIYSNFNISQLLPSQYPTYTQYLKAIKKNCQQNSIVMFVNKPLQPDSLKNLNQLFQNYDIWVILSQSLDWYDYICFYYRVYELIGLNDFDRTNINLLNGNEKQSRLIQSIALYELVKSKLMFIENKRIFKISDELSYLSINRLQDYNQFIFRTQYEQILKLSQDYDTKIIHSSPVTPQQQKDFDQRVVSSLHEKSLQTAIQREQIPYLPLNHSIIDIEHLQYSKQYNIKLYQLNKNQIPLCITIPTYNNRQNSRFKKVLNSVIMQDYKNYFIVLIDDFSIDQTLKYSIKHLIDKKFPPSRLKFVRNKKRMHATYNILNAAFNFCQKNSIQLILDGDDQLIGKYVFQTFNSIYQNSSNIWFAYSQYKDSRQKIGRSAKIQWNRSFINGQRQYFLPVGAIRTWKVQVLRYIPLIYHQKQNGEWLDTAYDDALVHCIIELVGIDRMKYIPEIMYEYNRDHGQNDDSSSIKKEHRSKDYEWIRNLQRLKLLERFDQLQDNKQVSQIMKSGRDVIFEQIGYGDKTD